MQKLQECAEQPLAISHKPQRERALRTVRKVSIAKPENGHPCQDCLCVCTNQEYINMGYRKVPEMPIIT